MDLDTEKTRETYNLYIKSTRGSLKNIIKRYYNVIACAKIFHFIILLDVRYYSLIFAYTNFKIYYFNTLCNYNKIVHVYKTTNFVVFCGILVPSLYALSIYELTLNV